MGREYSEGVSWTFAPRDTQRGTQPLGVMEPAGRMLFKPGSHGPKVPAEDGACLGGQNSASYIN